MQNGENINRAIALLYHDVVKERDFDSTGFRGSGPDFYKLDFEVFEEQVKNISKAAGRPASLVTEKTSTQAKEPFYFTFDDGGTTSLTIIAPLLEKYGHKAHFFIPTNYIGQPGFLTKEQIFELHRKGHDIGTHSHTHPARISSMAKKDLLEEWGKSKKILEDILGKPVLAGSIPAGFYSKEVASAASDAGIAYLFSSEPTDRPWKIEDAILLGRYTIRRDTPSDRVIKLLVNKFPSRLQQSLGWNTRKFLKNIGGDFYLKVRRMYFNLKR